MFLTLLFTTVLLVATKAFPGGSGDGTKSPSDMALCMGKPMNAPDKLKASFQPCHDKILGPMDPNKAKSDRSPKEFLCVFQCQMESLGLIDGSGKLKMESVDALIADILPKEAVDSFKAKIQPCFKEFGTEVKTTKGDCSSLEAGSNCTMKVMMEVCL